MRNSPQWLVLVAPFALAAGFALHQALARQSTLAWCAFTACAVVCVGILGLAVLYVWYCREAERDSRAGAYGKDWPRELDILLSNTSTERRALAAAQLAGKGMLARWPYRHDAIQVLESVAASRGASDMVIASALGALAQFRPKVCPPAVVKAARAGQNPYVLYAAMPLLAGHADTRKHLKSLVSTVAADDPNVQLFGASALKRALEEAHSPDERRGIEADMKEMASTNAVAPFVQRLVTDWLKRHDTATHD